VADKGSKAALRLFLSAPSAGLGIALTTQITALSWLLETRYELTIDDIALVWASGPLAGILGQLAAGHASDRSWWLGGRRRPYLLASGLLSAAALLALPHLDGIASLLNGLSLVMVAALVALTLDLAINVGLNPARALIADIMPAGDERAFTFATMQTLSGITGVAITVVGAWLGNLTMILIAALVVLPLTAAPAFLVKEPREIAPSIGKERMTVGLITSMLLPVMPATVLTLSIGFARMAGLALPLLAMALGTAVLTALLAIPIFTSRRRDQVALARRILFAQGLSWIGIFSMFVFLAPVVTERLPGLTSEASGRVVAVALGLFNLIAAITPLTVLMPLARRFRRAHVHAGAMAAMGIAFFAISQWVDSAATLWLCMALAGLGWGSLVSLPYAIFCDRVEARQLGLLLGVFNLAVVIPQLVVSLGLGGLAPTLGSRGDLFLIAAIALLASAFAWSRIPPIADRITA
jgi:maltose/moltooligosaccharide transporter